MKKFILSLVMIAMITPGLACDWIVGTPEARAAMAGLEPSHCRADKLRDTPKVKLFKDYSKAYLFKSVHKTGAHKPHIGKTVILAWNDARPSYDFTGGRFSIRGPPPDAVPPGRPSLILSTMRFRE